MSAPAVLMKGHRSSGLNDRDSFCHSSGGWRSNLRDPWLEEDGLVFWMQALPLFPPLKGNNLLELGPSEEETKAQRGRIIGQWSHREESRQSGSRAFMMKLCLLKGYRFNAENSCGSLSYSLRSKIAKSHQIN